MRAGLTGEACACHRVVRRGGLGIEIVAFVADHDHRAEQGFGATGRWWHDGIGLGWTTYEYGQQHGHHGLEVVSHKNLLGLILFS